jgi:hypothetical protein
LTAAHPLCGDSLPLKVWLFHAVLGFVLQGQTAAPPFCLGVEFLRYSQAMIEQQQPAASRAAAHDHPLPSSSSSSTGDLPASYNAAHRSSLQQQQQQRDFAEQDAFLQQDGFLQDTFEDQQQQQQDAEGLADRMQARREEINERLEGQDPLWFAKAFAHRASLNWESMKRMASNIAAQAKADLGFEPDETE